MTIQRLLNFWQKHSSKHLEVQLSEEPLILSCLVLFLKRLLDHLLCLFPHRRLLKRFRADRALKSRSLELKSVAGRHEVVKVDDLDKGLDLGALGNGLGRVCLGDLKGVPFNASNKSVAKGV